MMNYIWAGLLVIAFLFAAGGDVLDILRKVHPPETPISEQMTRIGAMQESGVEMAKTAVTLSLGLIGVIALWMGLLRIAQEAGLIDMIVRIVRPLLGPLFPGVPKDHPALGMIAMNMTGNALAIGNAATPLGIKAMQELQKLNPTPDTATNAMVMLLAINTAGVTLLPSPTLFALFGVSMGALIAPIILTTACSLAFAIVMARLMNGPEATTQTQAN